MVGSPCVQYDNGHPVIPLTSFTRPFDLGPFQEFVDARSGKTFEENTEPFWGRLYDSIYNYVGHPENKFQNSHHCGTMKRRQFVIDSDSITHIGKESNELEETETLGADEETYIKYQVTTIKRK